MKVCLNPLFFTSLDHYTKYFKEVNKKFKIIHTFFQQVLLRLHFPGIHQRLAGGQ